MSDPPRPEGGDGLRRVPIVVALAAVLLVGVLAGRAAGSGAVAGGSPRSSRLRGRADRCLLLFLVLRRRHRRAQGPAPGAVIIANTAGQAVTGAVTLVSSRGPNRRVALAVGPFGRTAVEETVPGGSPWIGAIVDVDAGGVAVSQQINGPLGRRL